jgi:CRP-like cAMP-binding protein
VCQQATCTRIRDSVAFFVPRHAPADQPKEAVAVSRTLAAAVLALAVIAIIQARRLNRLRSDMSEQYDNLNAAIDANDQAQTDALDRVAQDVAELKRRADQGTPVEDLRPLIDRIQTSTQRLQGVDPLADFPTAPTEPTG